MICNGAFGKAGTRPKCLPSADGLRKTSEAPTSANSLEQNLALASTTPCMLWAVDCTSQVICPEACCELNVAETISNEACSETM